MKSKKNKWKTIAWIFIILFILETLFLILTISLGIKEIKNEEICSYDICASNNYDAYYYDGYDKICYCYLDNEIIYQEYIK